tara:strand:+ start:770 stop:1015 length:246 start_codon:yes stop_codon:yes gene_type:complete
VSHPYSRVWYIKGRGKRENMTEVFASGVLLGFAAVSTPILIILEWEKHKLRKAKDHQRHVALVQAELDEVARKIREEFVNG